MKSINQSNRIDHVLHLIFKNQVDLCTSCPYLTCKSTFNARLGRGRQKDLAPFESSRHTKMPNMPVLIKTGIIRSLPYSIYQNMPTFFNIFSLTSCITTMCADLNYWIFLSRFVASFRKWAVWCKRSVMVGKNPVLLRSSLYLFTYKIIFAKWLF